jgi:hypothetical protein
MSIEVFLLRPAIGVGLAGVAGTMRLVTVGVSIGKTDAAVEGKQGHGQQASPDRSTGAARPESAADEHAEHHRSSDRVPVKL